MWEVDLTYIEPWLETQPVEILESVYDALERLRECGPTLGRPLVDRIKGSAFHNMKELRPVAPAGSEVRILFAFDPRRRAILLLAGDKSSGKNERQKWNGWYKTAIPRADWLYRGYLRDLEEK